MKLALRLSCCLENLTDLRAVEDKQWHLTVKCTQCQEVHSNPLICSPDDEVEMQGSRGTANIQMKCQFCSKLMSLNFDPKSFGAYTIDDSGFKTIAVVECRGMEVMSWNPLDGFVAKSSNSSTVFDDITLEDDFFEYDEAAACSVGITEIAVEVKREK
eukprot:Partr_v1_DN25876_c0_g1_i1_m2859 putative Chromosome 1 open reading frame 123